MRDAIRDADASRIGGGHGSRTWIFFAQFRAIGLVRRPKPDRSAEKFLGAV